MFNKDPLAVFFFHYVNYLERSLENKLLKLA